MKALQTEVGVRSSTRASQWWIPGLLALVLGLGSPAFAQEPGVTGELERTATASPKEKIEYVERSLGEKRAAVKAVQKLLDDARRQGNAERVECLNERAPQLGALAQVTEMAQTSMKQALDSGQNERADHELRKVAVAVTKTRQLLLEAQACSDDAGLASGETRVSVSGGRGGEPDETDPLRIDVMEHGFDPPQQSPFN